MELKLKYLLPIFSICFVVFLLLPFFLDMQFRIDLPQLGDFFDLLTPFVLITLYFLIYAEVNSSMAFIFPSRWIMGAFIIGAVLFIEGHGMHLAANSIARLAEFATGSSLFSLTYFFDEILSHYLWHIGIVLLSIGAIILQLKVPYKHLSKFILSTPAILYGLTVAIISVEGQTVFFMLPISIAMSIFLYFLIKMKKLDDTYPVVWYFFFAYMLTTIAMLIWGVFFNGFPQIIGTIL